ncbi:MAG: hypothetical protein ACMG6S_20400 [Byssovorax sp.]
MDPTSSAAGSESAILSRLIRPERDDLSPDAARSLLKLEFDEQDLARMHALTLQAQSGSLTGAELSELDSYRRVGHLLDLMRSKARRSLQGKSSAA